MKKYQFSSKSCYHEIGIVLRTLSRASTASSGKSRKTSPALPMRILYAGCFIWPFSESQNTGMPGARIGIWSSASWNSCLPTGLFADPFLQRIPASRRYSRRIRRTYRLVHLDLWLGRDPAPVCSILTAPSLTLSKYAYTEFYTVPKIIFLNPLNDVIALETAFAQDPLTITQYTEYVDRNEVSDRSNGEPPISLPLPSRLLDYLLCGFWALGVFSIILLPFSSRYVIERLSLSTEYRISPLESAGLAICVGRAWRMLLYLCWVSASDQIYSLTFFQNSSDTIHDLVILLISILSLLNKYIMDRFR